MLVPQIATTQVGPNLAAVGGSGDLRAIVGDPLTYGLIIALLMLIVSAATWAIASPGHVVGVLAIGSVVVTLALVRGLSDSA